MKIALQIALMGVPVLLVASCGNFFAPKSQTFDPSIDPLDSPGKLKKADQPVDVGPKFTPGSYVEVSDPNAGFYRRHPRGNERPDHRLGMGTPLKVVGEQGSYVKVETEAGLIGYVPAIMVSDKSRSSNVPIAPAPGRTVPVPASIDPIDQVDLAPLPAPDLDPLPGGNDIPFVAPEPEVPPISVEESPAPAPPIVPPDPVEPDE